MNAFSFFSFLAGCACAALGTLTLIKGRRPVHRLWALFTFAAAAWSFGAYFIGQATDPAQAVLYWRLAYVGVILIPAFIVNFTFAFLDLQRRAITVLVYLVALAFIGLDLGTDWFIRDVELLFGQFYYLARPSILYDAFVAWFALSAAYVYWLLWSQMNSDSELKRSQIRYILLALLIGLGGGTLAFLPVYGIYVYPVFNSAIVIGALVVAYAILRYRLMDIRGLARRTYFYFFAAAAVYAGYYGTIYLETRLFGSVYSSNALVAGALIAVGFSLLYVFFLKIVDGLVEKHVFARYHDYQHAILDLTKELNNHIELRKITELVVGGVGAAMGVDDVRLTLAEEIGGDLPEEYLARRAQPILQYELEGLKGRSRGDAADLEALAAYMKARNIMMLVPAVSNRRLVALIELGRKAGTEYTQDDWLLLEGLSFQVGTAVDKARMYARLESFSDQLKQKVAEQTEDIRAKNAHLRELLAMKTEFLRTAQHQLNTPLSAIKSSLAMVADGDYSKDEALKHVAEAAGRLGRTIDDFWVAYELEGEEMKLNLEKLDAEGILTSVLDEAERRKQAANKQLKLEVTKPAFKVPTVMADAQVLAKVLANLLDNAISYTRVGGVTVSFELEPPFLKINIQDTGSGISRADEKRLFRRFSRGVRGVSEHPDGSGLGLYVAKRAIEGMGGKISYETALGQGSTFTVSVPLPAPRRSAAKN